MNSVRRCSALLLIIMLGSLLPNGQLFARSTAPVLHESAFQPAEQRFLRAAAPTKLPSLLVTITTQPEIVQVGQAMSVNVTVINQAEHPAHDLIVRVPTPANTTLQRSPNEWSLPVLAGGAQATFTATLQVQSQPQTGAIVVTAAAQARELNQSVQQIGGALVSDSTPRFNTRTLVPHQVQTFRSANRQAELEFSAQAAKTPLTVREAAVSKLPRLVNFKRGLLPFSFEVTDAAGKAVEQLPAPMTARLRYTPEQLLALGISAADLTMFWFNPATGPAGAWEPLTTSVDLAAQTVSATVKRTGSLTLGDGSSPSASFIPSLQQWQMGLFTGNVSASYPIAVPAGPGGLKPQLNLSYSSSASDGKAGLRRNQQASWVGKDWSLDVPSIGRNKIVQNSNQESYFSLILNGQSIDLVRGQALVANPSELDLKDWAWHPTGESFVKARVVVLPEVAGRGGWNTNGRYERLGWQIWDKSGTRYDFSDDLWYGWNNCPDTIYLETYKWLLTTTTDVYGNNINYQYGRLSNLRTPSCGSTYGYIDIDTWLTSITWGGQNATQTPDRYEVKFISNERQVDTSTEWSDAQLGGINGAPRQTRRLDAIEVSSKPASTWQLVRKYILTYNSQLLYSDYSNGSGSGPYSADTTTPKLALTSFQELGQHEPGQPNAPALPSVTFTYGVDRGTDRWANGNWNRLTQISNGRGGDMVFIYDHLGQAENKTIFTNYRRVVARNVLDGRGQSATWTYAYTNPEMNSLGTMLVTTNNQNQTQSYPNSATLYYSTYLGTPDTSALLHQNQTEFRGHRKVIETDPAGTQTEHWFYQGDLDDNLQGCIPATGGQMMTDPCFQKLRNQEFWKGREFLTRVTGATSTTPGLLRETRHIFAVDPASIDYGAIVLSGLWKHFSYEQETQSNVYEGASTPVVQRTKYFYDPMQQSDGVQYGNLTAIEEYDGTTLIRTTKRWYLTRNDTSGYIVDRKWQEAVLDGQSRFLSLTNMFYDQESAADTIGTKGQVRRIAKYYDVPLQTSLNPTTLHSIDSSYGYDSFGNPTTSTTYAAAGVRTKTSTALTWSVPGNGSAASTTTTVYDAIFHLYPISLTQPFVNTVLQTTATYDYRLGLITSVSDANDSPTTDTTTSAEYDAFGRMIKLIKPGDTSTYPTLIATYADTESPARYTTCQREVALQASCRMNSTFYDGIGRQIQVKAEGASALQNTVTDVVYNGLGQAIQQSLPRTVAETQSSFTAYTAHGSAAQMRWTTTTYDGLGRQLVKLTADGARTEHRYSVTGGMTYYDVTDPNRRRTQQRYDALGHLVQVHELAGDCGNYRVGYSCTGSFTTPWSVAAITNYTYNPLDLLTKVTDARSNETTLSYDSLGRKLAMSDPDMGSWSYSYDVDGNLLSQTDAKGQTTTFAYDALSRLTSKSYSTGGTITFGYDDGLYGKGRRTSTSKPNITSTFQHDARGQVVSTTYAVPEMTGIRSINHSYNSAGQLTSLIYPGGDTVQYTYDNAGQPTSLCSTTQTPNVCYVTNLTYGASGQRSSMTLGNGVTQSWQFDPLNERVTSNFLDNSAGALFGRLYTYDPAGNVTTIGRRNATEVENFTYDHRNRLTRGWTTGTVAPALPYDETQSYDHIGNLLTKGPTGSPATYTYPASGATSVRPHAVTSTGVPNSYTYDQNGNMLTGGGRTFVWNQDNQPISITANGTTETYRYDAENERSTRMVNGVMTVYLGGIFEEDIQTGTTRTLYQLGGTTVAQRTRTNTSNTLIYLHGDHLGSISVATSSTGTVLSRQDFTPWGEVRQVNTANYPITQTALNYTGQRKDGTGLLFYNARYYDASLGRFLSADSIVPGGAISAGGVVALGSEGNANLTTDYHEVAALAGHNKHTNLIQTSGFWFQLGEQERKQAEDPAGPSNPQALNRYSYTLNNPIRYTDPTGHSVYMTQQQAAQFVAALRQAARELVVLAGLLGLAGASTDGYKEWAAYKDKLSKRGGFIAGMIIAIMAASAAVLLEAAYELNEFAGMVERANNPMGVIISAECAFRCRMFAINRSNGNGESQTSANPIWRGVFPTGPGSIWTPGSACTVFGGNVPGSNFWTRDHQQCSERRTYDPMDYPSGY